MKGFTAKLLSLCVAIVMVLTFAACGQKVQQDASAGGSSGQQDSSAQDPVKEPVKEPVELSLWHMWVSDGDGNKIPFQNVVKHVEEQLTDVKLVVDGVDNESYKTKIKTAVAANEAPDIFFTWAAGFSEPFVSSGKVLALDDYLVDAKENILEGAFTNFTYDGKKYGLPITLSVAPLFCNTELFETYDVKIPETYEDLLEATKVFKEAGITPMVAGARDLWPAMYYYDGLALRTAGADLCNKALNKEASFNQDAFIEAAQKLDELSKAGAFGDSSLGVSWDEAIIKFKEGQAAMIYNGNWVAGSAEESDSKVKGKVIATKFPMVGSENENEDEWFGGAADGFMISAATKDPQLAVNTVEYIAKDLAREAYIAGSGIPIWKVDVDESQISPLIAQIVDITSDATGFVLWWDVFLTGADADTHKNLVVEVLAGERTPESFAEEMQKLNEK